METEVTQEPLEQELSLALDQLAQQYPGIVQKTIDFLEAPSMEIVDYMDETGKPIGSYTSVSGRKTLADDFIANISPQARLANLLWMTNVYIDHPSYKKDLKGFVSKYNPLAKAENRKLHDEIESWVKENRSNKNVPFEDFIHFTEIPTNIWLGNSVVFRHFPQDEINFFVPSLGKIVFNSLKAGVPAEKIVNILEKKSFLIPFIGKEGKPPREKFSAGISSIKTNYGSLVEIVVNKSGDYTIPEEVPYKQEVPYKRLQNLIFWARETLINPEFQPNDDDEIFIEFMGQWLIDHAASENSKDYKQYKTEPLLSHLIETKGFKETADFMKDLADVVMSALEDHISEIEIVETLEKEDFTAPFIGRE